MDNVSIIGYHGASLENRDFIVNNAFETQKRADHWLGQGIYFYDDEDLAKWWARTKYRNTQICIIKTTIQADKKHVLNLDKPNDLDYFFQKILDILKNTSTKIKLKTSDNETKNLCLLLDIIKEQHNIAIVVMTFFKDRTSYGKIDIRKFEKENFALPLSLCYKETQICVSNNIFITHKENIYTSTPTKKRHW